jgi:4-hydroxy-3-polyprenylbenzoate decarboxylase
MGAIIAPPVPAFYRRPADLAAVIDHCAGRAIDLLGLGAEADGWTGELGAQPAR